MAAGHRNIKRIVHRIIEELDATKRVAKVTSWSDALVTLRAKIDIQIMNHNGYKESVAFKKHLIKKHDVMLEYFENAFSDYIASYDFNRASCKEPSEFVNCIWVCWWQGEEQAPEIVKKCINSIRKNGNGRRVIVITEANYKDYVSFPAWMEEKRKKGIISRTHYSDLLRLELLAEHGGIWVDSTFFCTGNALDQYFSWPVWSIKRPDYFHASIAFGYFANYSFGCDREHCNVFAIIRDFAFHYWRMNDSMIDYLFLDYLIVLVQRHSEMVNKAFKDITPNNPACDELYKRLANPYDAKKWRELKEDTYMFKLSWKQSYPKVKNGEKTFYGMLLDEKLS